MRYYLDTSALVKRYIAEPGSEPVDVIFNGALDSENVIIISYWNIGEAATVFDKFSRRTKEQDTLKLMELMLDEFRDLSRLQAIEISDLNNSILQDSIINVIKHHIYIADALQITTAKKENADIFVSADKRLVEAAENEKLKTNLLGN